MAVSIDVSAIEELKTVLKNIPFAWAGVDIVSKPNPTKLFQEVAIYNNQPARWEDGKIDGGVCPKCYVQGMETGRTQLLSPGTYLVDYLVKVHVIDQEYTAVNGQLDQNTRIFDYIQLVRQYLSGYKLQHGGHLTQSYQEQDYSHTSIYHFIIDFKCAFIDSSANTYTKYIEYPAPDGFALDLTVEIDT
jgi:hypothetical protein